jgi:hypothetical protein
LALGDEATKADAISKIRAGTQEWNADKSAYTQDRDKLRARERADMMEENAAKGVTELDAIQQAKLGWRAFWDSPFRHILSSAPTMLPTIATGALVSLGTGGNVAAGALAAGGVNAILTAGDVVSGVVDTVDNASAQELASNQVYQRLLAANNGDAGRAKSALIDLISKEATLPALALGGVAGVATAGMGGGATKFASDAISKVMSKYGFTAATKGAGLNVVNTAMTKTTPGVIRRGTVGALGESSQEFAEEGGGKVVSNLAEREGGFERSTFAPARRSVCRASAQPAAN